MPVILYTRRLLYRRGRTQTGGCVSHRSSSDALESGKICRSQYTMFDWSVDQLTAQPQYWQPTYYKSRITINQISWTELRLYVYLARANSNSPLKDSNIHTPKFGSFRIPFDLTISISKRTNKMQTCNRIYYSKAYWRLNMFWAAHRSSSVPLKADSHIACRAHAVPLP